MKKATPLRAGETSSVQLRPQHDFVDEVDDGHSRLLGVHLCKQVTHVLRGAACPPRHEAKHPAGENEPRKWGKTGSFVPISSNFDDLVPCKVLPILVADYMTLKRKKTNVHVASTYLLGVLSELIHLKHGCTERGTKTKETIILKSWRVSYRQATVAISLIRQQKHASKPNNLNIWNPGRCTTSPNKDTFISNKVWLNRLTSGLEGQDCWTSRCWLGSVSWKTAWWRSRIWNVMSVVISLSPKRVDPQLQLRYDSTTVPSLVVR